MSSTRCRGGGGRGGSGRGGCGRGGGRLRNDVPSTSRQPTLSLADDDDDETQDVHNQCMDDDETQGDEANSNSNRNELNPREFWFTKHDVVKQVSASIQVHYDEPFRNWKETPQHVRDHWFRAFKRCFTWSPTLEQQVRNAFDHKAAIRLKDMAHKAVKEGKPSWMSDRVHGELLKRANEDVEFKKRSEQAKKNKRGGSDGKLVHPGHYQGSISTVEVVERMAKEKKGVFPTAAEVYEKTHMRKDKSAGKVPCTEKSKRIMDDFKKKMDENREKGINKTPNKCYWEVVGGWKKGKVHGLGDGGDLFYEKSSGSSSKSTGRTYAPSLLSQLSTQVEEAQQKLNQMESERVEFEKQRANFERERLQLERDRLQFAQQQDREPTQLRQDMLEMKKKMAEFSQILHENCNSQFTPNLCRFDHDPSSGGAPCAT